MRKVYLILLLFIIGLFCFAGRIQQYHMMIIGQEQGAAAGFSCGNTWCEQLEETASPGYDETWSDGETTTGSATIDSDYATSNIGSPSGWGDDCLQVVITASGEDGYVGHQTSDHKPSYLYFELYVESDGLADGQEVDIVFIYDASWTPAYDFLLTKSGAQLELTYAIWKDGSSETKDACNISTSTVYKVEAKFDPGNDAWEWWVDNVSQGSGADLSGSHAAGVGVYHVGVDNPTDDATFCIDNFSFDTTGRLY